jgi:predicted nucleotidyltransferase
MARLDEVLARLRAHADDLRQRGVIHAGVFGSVARGEDGPDFDVDVAVEMDEARPIGLFQFAAIERFVSEIIGYPVDVIELHPYSRQRFREEVEQDRVHAF